MVIMILSRKRQTANSMRASENALQWFVIKTKFDKDVFLRQRVGERWGMFSRL